MPFPKSENVKQGEWEKVKNAEKPGKPDTFTIFDHDYVGQRKVLSNSQARGITTSQYDNSEYF